MQNPEGQILSVEDTGSTQNALVEVAGLPVCERCESGRGCGAGLLGGEPGNRQVAAVVARNLEVRTGDRVSIALAPQNVLRAAMLVYGLPLLGAVVAALLAALLRAGDGAATLATLVGLVSGILLARWRVHQARCLRDFTPTVVATLPAAGD